MEMINNVNVQLVSSCLPVLGSAHPAPRSPQSEALCLKSVVGYNYTPFKNPTNHIYKQTMYFNVILS